MKVMTVAAGVLVAGLVLGGVFPYAKGKLPHTTVVGPNDAQATKAVAGYIHGLTDFDANQALQNTGWIQSEWVPHDDHGSVDYVDHQVSATAHVNVCKPSIVHRQFVAKCSITLTPNPVTHKDVSKTLTIAFKTAFGQWVSATQDNNAEWTWEGA